MELGVKESGVEKSGVKPLPFFISKAYGLTS